jgi:hypothetical protein
VTGFFGPRLLENSAFGPVQYGQEASHALLYVYRSVHYKGRAVDPSVQVDNVELVRMDNNRYFSIWLAPGNHMLNAGGQQGCQTVNSFENGKVYFFKVDSHLKNPWVFKCFSVTPTDPAPAKHKLKELKPLNQRKAQRGQTPVTAITTCVRAFEFCRPLGERRLDRSHREEEFFGMLGKRDKFMMQISTCIRIRNLVPVIPTSALAMPRCCEHARGAASFVPPQMTNGIRNFTSRW